MSTRREMMRGTLFDVLDKGIVYTGVLGWIDMGHIVTLIKSLTDARITLTGWASLFMIPGQPISP